MIPPEVPGWVEPVRVLSGCIDALIMLYAFVRAFSFTGSNRHMRLSLSTLATVLTYSQASLIADPMPLTSRTWVGWVGSGVVLVLWAVAIRDDVHHSTKRKRHP